MKSLSLVFWLSLIIVIEAFALIPLTVYIGNTNEFSTSLPSILLAYAIPALILFCILTCLYFLLKRNERDKYIVLLSAIALLIWLQSFVLVWDYGVLNGSSIDWKLGSFSSWFDIILWISLITTSVIFYQKLRPFLWKLISVIFIIQGSMTLASLVTMNDTESTQINPNDYAQTKQNIFNFSPETNVLHLMLDGFQNDVFTDLLNNKNFGPKYEDDFSGFVHFEEATSSFPYTRFSIASFISNLIYKNDVPKDEFNNSAFKKDNIFNTAADSGFELDYVTDEYWANFHAKAKSNNILTHSNNNNNFAASNANKLLDLTLFRIAPHVIKKYIYNDQKWLISNFHNQEEFMQYRYFYHTAFMNDLTENLTVDRNSSIYKYIHILNTHNPMVTAPDCSYAGEVLPTTRLTLTIQSKCTLDTVVRLFNKMKALGIYDNTLIVMHADHGGWITPLTYNKQIVNSTLSEEIPRSLPGLASPLLAIKPIGGSGKLTKSSVLVSLSDIPDTISDQMNWNKSFGGQSAFDLAEGEDRERDIYYYAWQRDAWTTDYLGPLYRYTVNGSHYSTPWLLKEVIMPPDNINVDSD